MKKSEFNNSKIKEEINLKNIALAGGISLASMLGKDIKKLNPGLQVVKTGTIMAKSNSQSRLKNYEYHLVGINIQ